MSNIDDSGFIMAKEGRVDVNNAKDNDVWTAIRKFILPLE